MDYLFSSLEISTLFTFYYILVAFFMLIMWTKNIREGHSYKYNSESESDFITSIKTVLMQIYVGNQIWVTPPIESLLVRFSK